MCVFNNSEEKRTYKQQKDCIFNKSFEAGGEVFV